MNLSLSTLTLLKIILALLITQNTMLKTTSATFQPKTNWPNSSVKNLQVFGSGIAIDKNNNIIILHRSNRSNSGSQTTDTIPVDIVFILDRESGKILKTWGKDKFVKPHGIEVTENGDIFITDVKLHQVFKFEYVPSTEVWKETAVLTLGEQFVPGSDAFHFCSPADVAVMPCSGDFFVADGYCNSRIVKFDYSGKYLQEFGAGSTNPNIYPLPFNVTHSVAIAFPNEDYSDSNYSKFLNTKSHEEDAAIIFVADRNNGRIQCFSPNGTFLYEISYETFGPERAMLLSIAHTSMHSQLEFCNDSCVNYGILYAINGHLTPGQPKVFEIAVSKSTSKLISSFPVTVTQYKNHFAEFETPHDIVVSKNATEIYIVEAFSNLTLRKFTNVHSKSNVPVLSWVASVFYLAAFTVLK